MPSPSLPRTRTVVDVVVGAGGGEDAAAVPAPRILYSEVEDCGRELDGLCHVKQGSRTQAEGMRTLLVRVLTQTAHCSCTAWRLAALQPAAAANLGQQVSTFFRAVRLLGGTWKNPGLLLSLRTSDDLVACRVRLATEWIACRVARAAHQLPAYSCSSGAQCRAPHSKRRVGQPTLSAVELQGLVTPYGYAASVEMLCLNA
jgi:hypothetical protein